MVLYTLNCVKLAVQFYSITVLPQYEYNAQQKAQANAEGDQIVAYGVSSPPQRTVPPHSLVYNTNKYKIGIKIQLISGARCAGQATMGVAPLNHIEKRPSLRARGGVGVSWPS